LADRFLADFWRKLSRIVRRILTESEREMKQCVDDAFAQAIRLTGAYAASESSSARHEEGIGRPD
jgi:hypothetical protein